MSTSSGEPGFCKYCGHFMNEHTKASLSKCKRCKKHIYVCQVGIHATGGGWKICHVPCGCGQKHYPSTAKPARPLEPADYASTHPEYESPPLPDSKPTYSELFKSGDYLGFYGNDGEVVWTTQSSWWPTTTLYKGANVSCFQFDDESTGSSYFTWTLDVEDSLGATEPNQSERSLGKKTAHTASSGRKPSASHGRTLSAESIDPLQWDQERFEEETMASAMTGLTVGEGSSQRVEESLDQRAGTLPVSAQLNEKGMVSFRLKSEGKHGKKMVSTRDKWVATTGGYIFESKLEGCTFFASEIKAAKKK
ncbi:hypothetical protein AK830_g8148 [Neonectria ditissima]|uniref:Uncharacterized protein n=1 Tax=Neonectria ditissima TaxID=78410 RepID=A0A0P7BDB5_9HYPO|nr:hypothetical protein AK830_g8148 [Neonectria ditissima]